MKILILTLVVTLFSFTNNAAQFSESFVVSIFDTKVRVVAPQKKTNSVALLIENMTNGKTLVKVTSEKGINLFYATIESGKSTTTSLDFKNNKRLFIVPLSPPSQEIELLFGKKDYEIPEKK